MEPLPTVKPPPGIAPLLAKAAQDIASTDHIRLQIIQTVAFIVISNAFYQAVYSRLIQSTLNALSATVLWLTKEAVLHKALSENVQSFQVENERLAAAVQKLEQITNSFEQIGVDLSKLTEQQREALKKQTTQINALFATFNQLMQKQIETEQKRKEQLAQSLTTSVTKLSGLQQTLATVAEQVLAELELVNEENAAQIQASIATLTSLAEAAMQPYQDLLAQT